MTEKKLKVSDFLDFASTILIASKELNMSLNELVAIPEDDSWNYTTNNGKPVFTPASFVASALRELGAFHGLEVNAAEFTVKDIYQLDIYDKKFERPDLCRESDYLLDYCQLFGTNRLILQGFSTVHPYAHMNERCPNGFENSVWPSDC